MPALYALTPAADPATAIWPKGRKAQMCMWHSSSSSGSCLLELFFSLFFSTEKELVHFLVASSNHSQILSDLPVSFHLADHTRLSCKATSLGTL